MQTFKFDKKHSLILKISFVMFLGLFTLVLYTFFIPDPSPYTEIQDYIILLFSSIVFGVITLMSYIQLKKLPFQSIAVDDDGIWYNHLSKEKGLVPWKAIARLKHSDYLECLFLLDSNGKSLIRINVALSDFNLLKELISKNTMNNTLKQVTLPATYSKSRFYYINVTIPLLISVSGMLLKEYLILGLGVVMLIVTIYKNLTTISSLTITRECLKCGYTFQNKQIHCSTIESIDIPDSSDSSPEIHITLHPSSKVLKIYNFNTDMYELYFLLKNIYQNENRGSQKDEK